MTVDTNVAATEDLLGKYITDLQSNVVVNNTTNKITGTLNYISDYTGFSGDVAEQSGNYLVLHVTVPEVEGATIQVGLNNLSTLDSDGIVVCRVADKDSQTVRVVASKEGYTTVTKTFDIKGLTCEAQAASQGG